ncbi:hypothetical protein L207DRAFT_497048 [Hyaloscypha variabilis F]|uniref:CFEM domain-containing protein n=1 Tax=Hyaloscypha variabilis (strain UAMH 11265 / GT02V1 / F) TaxID=1149755 RepID=A0A2J6R920_HYAVF|nr:hypothetical protein L207DRAFT_497048 [Hyaloscypha variabilis F]
MLFPLVLSIAVLSSAALAQANLQEALLSFPACSANCSLKYLSRANCALTDLRNCLCTNDTLQYEIGACVLNTCNATEQILSTTISQNEICNGVPQPWQGYRSIRASIIISSFTFPIIALRFISRIYITRRVWFDDWAILATAVFMVPNTAIPIYMSYHGFGRHFYDVPPSDFPLLQKLYYASQIFYVLVQNIPKFSILLLYVRVFPIPRFQIILKLAMTWQAAHTIAFLFAVILQCMPLSSLWDPFIAKKQCISLSLLIYIGAALSIFEDIVIMLLPIFELKGLNLGLRKRIALAFMFALGSFSCVTSMIRLKYVIGYGTSVDQSWTNVDVVIWSEVETYTAVMCSCLMCIRPLVLKYLPNIFPTTKASSSQTPYASGHLHNANMWSAKVASRIRAERASRHGIEVLGDEEVCGMGELKGRKEAGGRRESGKIMVTTESVIEYEDDMEMQGVGEREGESSVSTEIGTETGSKENLHSRSVLKV